jgi:hypothetical protein
MKPNVPGLYFGATKMSVTAIRSSAGDFVRKLHGTDEGGNGGHDDGETETPT